MSQEAAVASHTVSRQWYKSLKCSICLDYFSNPHTLKCGHSFCIRCLSRLARVTVEQSHGLNPHQIKLHCPTCRRPISVKAITRRQLTVNYSLQEFVENWLSEQSTIQARTIKVRSVGSQSEDEGSGDEESAEVSREVFGEVPVRHTMPTLSNSEIDTIANQVQQRRGRTTVACGSTSDESDGSYDNMDENQAAQNWRPAMSRTTILRHICVDIYGVLADVVRCPNRSVMAIVWSGYTFSIMLISSGFFPYMLLYSILFFLILYAESMEQRRAERERRLIATED